MALTKNQQLLIKGLKILRISEDTIIGIMLLMRTDEKADRLLDWMVEHKELAINESNVIRAAEEIFDEKRNREDDFPSPELFPKEPPDFS